ncbi:hypothetical protein SH611_03105 [Geminicoccaceae bacterium 1502E]|nr:hypothetical protein [Geminicoccaceae bacterium 1502E]
MAFEQTSLSALSYANGFTLWHYRTSDAIDDVDTAGYFSRAGSMLRVGDFILVNAGLGVVPSHGMLVVLSSSGGVVDVSNVTPVGTLNTD